MSEIQTTRNHDKKIYHVDPNELKPLAENARLHPEREMRELEASIRKYGFTAPVLVAKSDLTIVAGHARVEAAKKIGLATVPIIKLDIQPHEYMAYSILDNRVTEFASWDYERLVKNIEAMEDGMMREALAFSNDEVADLKHWQDETAARMDMSPILEDQPTRRAPAPVSGQTIEIVLTVPLEVWDTEREAINLQLASVILGFEGMRIFPAKVKDIRAKG